MKIYRPRVSDQVKECSIFCWTVPKTAASIKRRLYQSNQKKETLKEKKKEQALTSLPGVLPRPPTPTALSGPPTNVEETRNAGISDQLGNDATIPNVIAIT